MERMDKGDLLHIGTAYVEVHTFKGKDYVAVGDFSTTTNALSKEILELEEENKKLKEINESQNEEIQRFKDNAMQDMREITELEIENKKLKEEVETLELWLDNKEKLNEEYRKQIDKLKSDLGECECSFLFENDEVGYRKREYKRLKKWIKDHCKGYGNLFPEDEMKRQRKKADKKRKKTKEDDELIYEEGLYD